MGVHVRVYIIVGVDVGPDWGKLPTDGKDRDPSDDWHDRYGWMVIYEPKKGDLVTFADMDGNRYRYIGRVINSHYNRWDDSSEFFEHFTPESLQKEIDEVSATLKEKLGITQTPALHIISNYC